VEKPRRARLLFGAAAAAALLFSATAAAADDMPRVLVVEFDNDVNPVTQEYLQDEMHRAEAEDYAAVVIEMDTPGGLGSSMREIVKTMLDLKVPVVVYVAPPGSSADSAGAVIGQAADLLAMAPQTNIGSSTPVSLGGEDISEDLRRKIVNDAAAYIQELALEHGRNGKAARRMVTQAANYGAREALELNVVDVISPSVPALLAEIDGTKTVPKGMVLDTAGASVERVEMSFWKRALDLLIDPNVIALMLSIGLIGIVVELWNPGLVFPGTVGAISLIVGLYGLQVLPVSIAGLLLLLVSAGFFVAEAFVVSHGALTVAGAITFVIGALMLFDPAGETYQVSLWTAIGIAGTLALLLGVALTRVARVARRPSEVGVSQLIGGEGVVRRAGYVFVDGELWRARSGDGSPLVPGEHVRVESIEDGLELVVVGSGTSTERG
jgi:membrane-bound serine protease (ClpP class)